MKAPLKPNPKSIRHWEAGLKEFGSNPVPPPPRLSSHLTTSALSSPETKRKLLLPTPPHGAN